MTSEIKVISPALQQQNSIKNNPTNTTLFNPSAQI
jgi:hypothetical protein